MKINLSFFPYQEEIFLNFNHKFVILPKGRRLGFTEGAARACILYCHYGISPILWADVINSNIDRYVERIFIPFCRRWNIAYDWNKIKREFRVGKGYIDFRSAERPYSFEGNKYRCVIMNEAGIILQNKYLWENAIRPMMLDYADSFAIIGGTPKGKTHKGTPSLFYEMVQKAESGVDGYYTKTYTSFDNPKLLISDIKEMEADMPSTVVRQEIYGEFIDTTGGLLDRKYIKTIDRLPEKIDLYMGVDLAIAQKERSDYTSLTLMGIDDNRNIYIIEVWRFKASSKEIKSNIISMYNRYPAVKLIGIERVQGQAYLIDDLLADTILPIDSITPKGNKIERFYSLLARYENGLVYHYSKGAGIDEYTRELIDFPEGGHDDMIDSTVYAYITSDPLKPKFCITF